MNIIKRARKSTAKAARDTGVLIACATYCTWCVARMSGRFVYEHPVVTGAVAVALPGTAGMVVGAATVVGLGVRVFNAVHEARIGRHADLQS